MSLPPLNWPYKNIKRTSLSKKIKNRGSNMKGKKKIANENRYTIKLDQPPYKANVKVKAQKQKIKCIQKKLAQVLGK